MAAKPNVALRSALRSAVFPQDKESVGRLFLAYAEALGVDLTFQNFTDELSSLPGKYAPENGGEVYLVSTDAQMPSINSASPANSTPSNDIGCVAIRRLFSPEVCELKRLYVSPDARGLGVAYALMDAAIKKAKELGYKEMLLDTLDRLVPAIKIYEKYGFVVTEKYYENPIKGVIFMKLVL